MQIKVPDLLRKIKPRPMKKYYPKFLHLLFMALVILPFFTGCKRDSPANETKPLLKTNEVVVMKGVNGAVVMSGEFVVPGRYSSIQYGFSLDLTNSFQNAVTIPAGHDLTPVKFEVSAQMALMPGHTYYVRTWAKTKGYEVTGNVMSFQTDRSPDPVIEKITPASALWGDTIMVTGKNFDYFGKDNIVKFNDIQAVNCWGRGDTIHLVVPYVKGIQNYNPSVTVSVYDAITKVGFPYTIKSPVISGISATEGQYPDTVTVTGENFSRFGMQLLINGVADSVITLNKNSLSFVVPYLKVDQLSKIEYHDLVKNYTVAANFHYHGQGIKDWQKSAWIGDTIKVYATNIDFRRFNVNIENTDPILIKNYADWQTITNIWKDSLAFVLKGTYSDLTFNFDILFGDKYWDYPVHPTLLGGQINISHKKPVITGLQKEGVYFETLWITGKGNYFESLSHGVLITSLDGKVRVSFPSTGGIPGDVNIVPGDYMVQFYSFDRLSDPAYFTIKAPVISGVMPSSVFTDQLMQVTGINLPFNGDYIFTQRGTGRAYVQHTYVPPANEFTMQEVDPSGIIGAGSYDLSMKIGDIIYKYLGTVEIKDHFTYVMRTLDPVPQNFNYGCGFTVNNKMYVTQIYGLSIIDLASGNVRTKDSNYQYNHQPVFLNDKIYMQFVRNELVQLGVFNPNTEDWDPVNMDGVSSDFSLKGFGASNNHLIAFSANGDIYQYDTTWHLLGNLPIPLYYINYVHSMNGNLYLCDFYMGSIVVVSVADWTITKSIQMPATYNLSMRFIFEIQNEMYICGVPGGGYQERYDLYKLNTGETFEKLSPFLLKFDYFYTFCPDGHGNVFFENQNYVYKFNP